MDYQEVKRNLYSLLAEAEAAHASAYTLTDLSKAERRGFALGKLRPIR